jgi:hypothetical protein
MLTLTYRELQKIAETKLSEFPFDEALDALMDVDDCAAQPGYPDLPVEALVEAARKHLIALAEDRRDVPPEEDFTSSSIAMRTVKDAWVARWEAKGFSPPFLAVPRVAGSRRGSRTRRVVRRARSGSLGRSEPPEPEPPLAASPRGAL